MIKTYRRKSNLTAYRSSQPPFIAIAVVRTLIAVFLLLSLLAGFNIPPASVRAAPNPDNPAIPLLNGQQVIQLVNQVRSANGLPPYNLNGALMAAAEGHSQYQASIGSTSHSGAGGSSVTSRAIAAGYGGGASVSVAVAVSEALKK